MDRGPRRQGHTRPPRCCPGDMLRPPQTPTEAMEFLARSWSVSSAELSRALSNTLQLSSPIVDGAAPPPPADDGAKERPAGHPEVPAVRPPAHDNSPSKHVKPKLLLPPPHSWTVAGWLKDHKEKRREEARARNAQIHAATAVAGVAAAVAAVAAATAFSSPVGTAAVDVRSASAPAKTSAAIASAAALVASHCVEMAHAVGADRAQILTVVGSAVSIRTTGDIMALTAGAATALRGAAALRGRLQKGIHDKLSVSEWKEPQDFVSKGGELLKRTRKGVLHWKKVSVNVDGNAQQIVIKMTSVHIGGTFVKKKKSVVIGVDPEISPWPSRHLEEGSNQRSYFGIKTPGRLIEFECRSKKEKQLWVEGIQQMLHSHGRTSTDHCVN